MTLLAGGQQQVGLVGHAGHLLALADAVGHQRFGHHVQAGFHGGDGRRGVQMERQGDDHRLDAVGLRVSDQLLVGAVDLDVLLRFRVAFPTVNAHQARPGLVHLLRPDAGERPRGDSPGQRREPGGPGHG